jgi:hypothetical protein
LILPLLGVFPSYILHFISIYGRIAESIGVFKSPKLFYISLNVQGSAAFHIWWISLIVTFGDMSEFSV